MAHGEGKFAGLTIELPTIGRIQLTSAIIESTETAIYRITHPGIVVKTFDLSCGKVDEISFGPYTRFGLELANFEDIIKQEDLRRFVPTYYGANVNYKEHYAYIAMEYLEGQDLQSWCNEGANGGFDPVWVNDFKEMVYDTLFIMTRFHKHGIIMIDFKPDNIIRLSKRGVKFVDLGAFFTPRHYKVRDKYAYSATPDYAELLIDASNIDAGVPPTEASDIFSVGVALFEMATGSSRLEIQPETADEILLHPEVTRFRDSQIRDLWHSYPHLKELLPAVEHQLKDRRILFSEFWQLIKSYLALKVANWETLPAEQRDQFILTSGTTFIQEQLPEPLQWLAGPIAQSTVLRSLRFKKVSELMRLIENPISAGMREDIEQTNSFIQYLRDNEQPYGFVEHINMWEARCNPIGGHWSMGAPIVFANWSESALFTFLKEIHRERDDNRFYGVVTDFEADYFEEGRLTLYHLREDHFAWIS
jgi:serine/threonine protein kinase